MGRPSSVAQAVNPKANYGRAKYLPYPGAVVVEIGLSVALSRHPRPRFRVAFQDLPVAFHAVKRHADARQGQRQLGRTCRRPGAGAWAAPGQSCRAVGAAARAWLGTSGAYRGLL